MEVRRRHAGVAHDALGQALVQREAHDHRIGQGAGDAVALEQRRHLGLAPDAASALGDVEDEVPAFALGETRDQGLEAADAHCLVAERADRGLDRVDGVGPIELGRFLEAQPLREIVGAEVIGQADAQADQRSAGLPLSAPRVPSGSA